MCYGDDDDLGRVNDIDDVVPELAQTSLPHQLCKRLARQRTFRDGGYRRFQITQESIAQTAALLVEVFNSFVDLCFRRSQKTYGCHFPRDRKRENTSSAATASMLPALYSA
ncbi:MAG: hypothetical protein JWO97_3241 [Acidobacteria bacterium]|nr:hypothetical protein [Acidobacteriota bacterium]